MDEMKEKIDRMAEQIDMLFQEFVCEPALLEMAENGFRPRGHYDSFTELQNEYEKFLYEKN